MSPFRKKKSLRALALEALNLFILNTAWTRLRPVRYSSARPSSERDDSRLPLSASRPNSNCDAHSLGFCRLSSLVTTASRQPIGNMHGTFPLTTSRLRAQAALALSRLPKAHRHSPIPIRGSGMAFALSVSARWNNLRASRYCRRV